MNPLNGMEMKLFPNPAGDILFIEMMHDELFYTITISDLTGKIMMAALQNNNKAELHIDQLSEGMYIISVDVGEEFYRYSFVKL